MTIYPRGQNANIERKAVLGKSQLNTGLEGTASDVWDPTAKKGCLTHSGLRERAREVGSKRTFKGFKKTINYVGLYTTIW